MKALPELSVILQRLRACEAACKWADDTGHKKAWESCKRGDWLLWIAGNVGVDRKVLVRAACKCARRALKYTTDPRVKA